MTPLAFIDTETTGLDADHHEIWEVALILRRLDRPDGGPERYLPDEEYVWQLPVDLSRADPIALNIGHFHERRWAISSRRPLEVLAGRDRTLRSIVPTLRLADWATTFVNLTRGAHLVGNVVSFDEERLRRLLRRHGQCGMWHYHLVDVEALAAGWLAAHHRGQSPDGPLDDRFDLARPPWDSTELSLAVGIDPESYDRHTALGDARWARDTYDAVIPPASSS